MIDMSELLHDPIFVETCTLIRTAQTRDNHGRIKTAAEEIEIKACLQPSSPTELTTLRDLLAADVTDLLDVYSLEELTAGDATHAPDRIKWRGQVYEVISAENYIWTGNYTKAVAKRVINDNEPI